MKHYPFQHSSLFAQLMQLPAGGVTHMPRQRLLFVDVDGVLCTETSYRERRHKAERDNLERHVQLLGLKTDTWRIPDKKLLALLDELLDASGAIAVMASTWRTLYDLEDMNRLYAHYGLLNRFEAYTPYVPGLGRGREIKQVIDCCPVLESFVILDDLIDDMAPFSRYVVSPDKFIGLTAEHVQAALDLFACETPTLVARE